MPILQILENHLDSVPPLHLAVGQPVNIRKEVTQVTE